jgi:hypothetical protein
VADNNLQERAGALRQAAAEELASRLQGLADALTESGARPKRFWYGNARIKRRSPSGFLLDTFGPHLLLPDGRLWHHHSRRNPEGIYFDARVDHTRAAHGPISLGGRAIRLPRGRRAQIQLRVPRSRRRTRGRPRRIRCRRRHVMRHLRQGQLAALCGRRLCLRRHRPHPFGRVTGTRRERLTRAYPSAHLGPEPAPNRRRAWFRRRPALPSCPRKSAVS